MLGAFTYFDEESTNFRLSPSGQELAIRAIAQLLETDHLTPQAWMANRIAGLHQIDGLAT